MAKKCVLNARTSQMSGGGNRGGGWGCRGRRGSRYRGTFHGQTPTTPLALDPRPLQGTYQRIAKVLGEEAINVKRDGVIDHF